MPRKGGVVRDHQAGTPMCRPVACIGASSRLGVGGAGWLSGKSTSAFPLQATAVVLLALRGRRDMHDLERANWRKIKGDMTASV